ncbi:hydrolase [Maribacter hydrothermalis]|uniref:Hydrolase n=1 Tax=Maribacter hydrothermalis TaxID=1836467 RepID=A0A1B7ZCL6_9FLAO|nr:hydrolase [Maribacter hydrothermalis]APQ18584.1 hydrolase [Maribacter hydrothermalis]OBR40860.1 hydrolase [Maribacter hydrothermalis]
MRSKIFLYLFLFMSLICLYLVVSSGKMAKANSARVTKLENEINLLKDSVQESNLKVMDMQYFSLENNDDALAYFEHLNIDDPARYIADKLLETNTKKGDNPLVPYEGMQNDFKINKIKILNHKWILTDFSDGKYWGELLIKYELKDDLGVDFILLDHLLYTESN